MLRTLREIFQGIFLCSMKESLVGSAVVIIILHNTAQRGCLYLFSLFASILIRFPYPLEMPRRKKAGKKAGKKGGRKPSQPQEDPNPTDEIAASSDPITHWSRSPTPVPSSAEVDESTAVQPPPPDCGSNPEEIEGENATGPPSREEQTHQQSQQPNVASEDNSRYNWAVANTSLLLEALIDAKLSGQQGDGGFKQTTWNNAIKRIQQADPTKTPPTVVKCRSRFETLKSSWKKWAAHLKQTENRSGWWDADGLPQADVIVMDIYFARYPKFKRFRHEKLPFCGQLKTLLENRLATGSHASPQNELELDDSSDESRDENRDENREGENRDDNHDCDEPSGDEEGSRSRTQNSTHVESRATSRPATNARKRSADDAPSLRKKRSTGNELYIQRLEKSDEQMSTDIRFLADALVNRPPPPPPPTPLALATRLLVKEFNDMSVESKSLVLHAFRQDNTLAEVFVNLQDDKESMRQWIQDIISK